MISERTASIAAVVLVLLGAILAYVTIGKDSLWIDEGYTFAISKLPLNILLNVPFDTHPPGYYLLVRWATLFGESELVIRSVSAVSAVLASVAFYVLARRHLGNVGALAALAVWVGSYTFLVYANDARNYALLLMLFLVAYAAIEQCVRTLIANDQPRIVGLWPVIAIYILSGAVGLYTHTATIFYLFTLNAVMWLAAIAFKRGAFVRITAFLAAINIGVVIIGLPRLLVILSTTGDFAWLEQPSPVNAAVTLATVVGPNDVHPVVMLAYFIALAIGAVLILVRRDWTSVAIAFFLGVYPAFIWAVGFVAQPIYMERIVLPALVGGALCAGAFAAYLKPKAIAATLTAIALGATAMSSAAYVGRSPNDDSYGGHVVQDWRLAAASVDQADTVVILADGFSYPSLDYYLENPALYVNGNTGVWPMDEGAWLAVFGAPVSDRASDTVAFMETTLTQRGDGPIPIASLATGGKRIAVVGATMFHTQQIAQYQRLASELAAAGYQLVDDLPVRGITVSVYEMGDAPD